MKINVLKFLVVFYEKMNNKKRVLKVEVLAQNSTQQF